MRWPSDLLQRYMRPCLAMGSFCAFGVLLLVTIFYSLPSNAISTRDGSQQRRASVSWAQQSWVFFTKSPSGPEVEAAVLEDSDVFSNSKFPQSKPSNWFGIKRSQRAQGPELAQIADKVENWVDCKGLETRLECVLSSKKSENSVPEIKNPARSKSICGNVIILFSKPVRWKFRDFYEHERVPVRAGSVKVVC